jgi:hypothetical protein
MFSRRATTASLLPFAELAPDLDYGAGALQKARNFQVNRRQHEYSGSARVS